MRRRSGVTLAAVVAAFALSRAGAGCAGAAERVPGQADGREQAAARHRRLRSHRGRSRQVPRDLRARASRRAGCAPTASRRDRVDRIRTSGAAAPGRLHRERRRVGRLDPLRRRGRRREGAVRGAVRPARSRVVRQEGEPRHDPPRAPDLGPEGDEERRHRAGQHEARRALQRAAARPRVAGRRDLPPHARLLRRQLRRDRHGARQPGQPDRRPHGRRGHPAGRHARALVRLHLQPGRLRVHVHRGQPAVAQEHGRQRRRRDPRRGRGRRRPEPQLLHQLGPRQRGLLG